MVTCYRPYPLCFVSEILCQTLEIKSSCKAGLSPEAAAQLRTDVCSQSSLGPRDQEAQGTVLFIPGGRDSKEAKRSPCLLAVQGE